MPTNSDLVVTAERVQLGNYRPAPFVLSRGEGCRVEDVEGNRYLDLCGGIAVTSVGHAHPKLARAIAEQAERLMHVSNLFYNDRAIELAEQLQRRTPFGRFFFCNSGAESIEAALKLARRHHYAQGDADKTRLISASASFHGRTLGALSLTGQPKYRAGMEPVVGDIEHVPYNDLQALEAAIGPRTAAVFLEVVQGEGGVVVGEPTYLRGARELCDRYGALLVFDEIQTGYGRTGRFLAQEHSGVRPDVCTLAKGIAGGFPLGALAVQERFNDALPPGTHATTFGGNPLACAAAAAVLRIFDEEGLVDNAAQRGVHLRERLEALSDDAAVPAAREARGVGLLQGLVLAEDVDPVGTLKALQAQGVLLSIAGGNVLRFTPALSVSDAELDEGLDAVRRVLRQPPRKEKGS